MEGTAGRPQWVFYEGPPTANGRPGTHHIEARAFKDVFPRFKTMQGWHVPRRAGWDCHGLPVEIAVEQELGFAGKPDIERYGIAEFNARCRESVERHVGALLRPDPPHGLLGRHVHRLLDDGPAATSRASGGRSSRSSTRGCWSRTTGSPRTAPAAAPAVRPRGRPGLRDPDRPVGLRPAAGHQRRVGRQGRPAGLDDDAVDAAVATPPSPCTPTSPTSSPARTRGTFVVAEPPGDGGARRGRRGAGPHDRPRLGAGALPAAVRARGVPRGRRALRRPGRLRHHRGRHRAGAPVPRLRRRRPRRLPRLRAAGGRARSTPPGTSCPTSRWSAATSSRPPTPRWSQDLQTRGVPAPRSSATSTAIRTAGAATRR